MNLEKPKLQALKLMFSPKMGMAGGPVLDLAAAVREGFARWLKGRIDRSIARPADLAIGPGPGR
jgi:hypothetical protein